MNAAGYLRELRLEAGLTQRELAAHIGGHMVELFFAGQNVCLRPALRAAYAAGMERAAEIAAVTDYGDRRDHCDCGCFSWGDGTQACSAAIRAEMLRDSCPTCHGDGDVDDGSLSGKQCPDCKKEIEQ
ncbi:hypothetical protein amb2711 [Paramagnetospirillum magneticum AMB-1]|uniref:HTH cro/C1-type domain-containing protein n=1 Tax=Paramagnetospirillum magneticum (strain ATCC 700264 / AMB-1) TaxID=342108 RepID=Q2W3R0_PARM1|nr:hypothetical protein amb2711 [Paramagnetospirillum magneticum AMB-1]